MTAEEYIVDKLIPTGCPNHDQYMVLENDAYEAIDLAEKEVAQEIHKMISNGATMSEIDKYVTDICEL